MNVRSTLPPGFEVLQPFVESWAVAGAANRAHRRLTSSEPERMAFYETAKCLLAAALDHLDNKPVGQFDDREEQLMNLMLSFGHVSLAVEVQGDNEVNHACGRRHLKITKASADMPGA